jgi:copper chaperone CopZ
MPTAKFSVPDLQSRACEQRLETHLRTLRGVYAAVANHTDRCLEVDFEDDEIGVPEVVAAARDAGYTARLVG